MPAIRLLTLLTLWLASSLAWAQAPVADPWKNWLSANSAHFRIHYRAEHRGEAERAARAAEHAYPRVTQLLKWEPRGRTEIVLFSETDLPNGYATALPYNTIGVILAPPDEGALLDNSDWLDLLLTHEFTHTVHLDKVRGAPQLLQSIFGRVPWFFPNAFQPKWAIEGLAVYGEGDAPRGQGRLHGATFEALLRAQAPRGFPTLAELNADGRALPESKSYLYGAYFYDYLARRYGKDAIFQFIDQYSGNIVPRFSSNPKGLTGKTMEALWEDFTADLAQRVLKRGEPLRKQAEASGDRVLGPRFELGAVVALPSGAALAVVNDGLNPTQLLRVTSDGQAEPLMRVNPGTRLSADARGRVLLMQPDVCNARYLAFDLYRVDEDRATTRLTTCAHLRRAVQAAADTVIALQLDGARTQVVKLDGQGQLQALLWPAVPGTDLIDLAADPSGRIISIASHTGADWRVHQIDLDQPQAPPTLRVSRKAPLFGLRHGPAGLEFIAQINDVNNVWRLDGDSLLRLTHSLTGITAHGGTQVDGALQTVELVADGKELKRLSSPKVLERVAALAEPGPSRAAGLVSAGHTGDSTLPEGQPYAAWRALHPRSWLPAAQFDRGLQAFGASTFGADALGWHQYAATALWETSQRELLGSVEYLFAGQHHLALSRTLKATAWVNDGDRERTTVYERHLKAQWLSAFPLVRLDRTLLFGAGAALDRVEQVQADTGQSRRARDARLVAALIDFDTRTRNWWSLDSHSGQRSTLLVESYKPFARDDGTGFDGTVVRADLRGYWPLGRSVFAARHTEVRASGRTQAFQLGGALDAQLQLGTVLNERDLALRGYRGDEAELRGSNARVTTLEWRTPLADVDRHGMSPPVGLNRLSAAVFFDVGGTWSAGGRPAQYFRGAGLELQGELKLLYALGLQLRAGLAHGLDEPGTTRGYLTLGQSF